MDYELDHFFILTEPNAPAVELLTAIGLEEGTENTHLGQGTANRRFFFANSMLEFLYIRDLEETAKPPVNRLRLAERFTDNAASPFGLIIKPRSVSNANPFPGWRYYPQYLDEGQYLLVGENSEMISEPLCVFLPTSVYPSVKSSEMNCFGSVTELRITVPEDNFSLVLETVGQCELITLNTGEQHLMEVVFNWHEEDQSKDLRPSLPLIVHW